MAVATTPDPMERFRGLFDQFAADAAHRDTHRLLPFEAVRQLADAGFGALRLPVTLGGSGFTVPELADALVELATADPNLAQAFRGHFAFAEDRLVAPEGPARDRWLERIAAGELIGNAWSETHNALGSTATRVARTADGWRVDGRKFYTTGSIFADWIDATVATEDGAELSAVIRARQEGVRIADDWDGFGQRTTGTGGIVFNDARVEADDVFAFGERFRYQTAFYQLNLLCVLAGIARGIERDTAEQLRTRSRVYSHGSSSTSRTDPQLLAIVGEISAGAFVASTAVDGVAHAVQRATETAPERDSPADRSANNEAEIAASRAQVVLTRLVPELATLLFDSLGASALTGGRDLDRHWRNARTVASHNPTVFKARIVGDWVVNGTEPHRLWAIGTPADASRGSSEAPSAG